MGAAGGAFAMSRPRVLLADDHRMVAEGVKRLLEEEFELTAVVEDGRQLVEAARRLRPDVIVADITMPHLSGMEALEQLKRDNPEVRVVFLTMHKDVAYARRALEAGASGYVLKHSAQAELFLAVRAALDGKTFISPTIAGDVFRDLKASPTRPSEPVDLLTHRQREILQLFAEGCFNQGDRLQARHIDANRRIPQISDDGVAQTAKQRRADPLRHQEWDRRSLSGTSHPIPCEARGFSSSPPSCHLSSLDGMNATPRPRFDGQPDRATE